MDRNTLFTDAIKSYNIPLIKSLLKIYDNDVQFLILEWWDLSFDGQGVRQIKELIKGAILRLDPVDLEFYFNLLVAKHLYISDTVKVKDVKHDYREYYEYAMNQGRRENAEYLKTLI
jgi:hypothetical protein